MTRETPTPKEIATTTKKWQDFLNTASQPDIIQALINAQKFANEGGKNEALYGLLIMELQTKLTTPK